jgi:hypothetical protein
MRRPRQRLIANLHGEPDPLRALAKITMMWDGLQAELEELVEMPPGNNQSSEQRADWLRRFEKIERNLAALGKDGAAVEKHCTATEDELQAAIDIHLKEGGDVLFAAWGTELALKQRKANAALDPIS